MTALTRGITGRCGRCGAGGVLKGFSHLERCPRCGLRLDREEGFRAGALGVNTIVTFGLLAIVVAVGVAVTAPDVPALPLGIVAVSVAVVVPIVGYPLSLTTWAAMDVWMRPPGADTGTDAYDERARRVSSTRLAERLGPSLDEVVAAWAAALAGDAGALGRAFDGKGPAAVGLRTGAPPAALPDDPRVVDHELEREAKDGWWVRFTVAGGDGGTSVSLRALLRWAPDQERWFAWSIDQVEEAAAS